MATHEDYYDDDEIVVEVQPVEIVAPEVCVPATSRSDSNTKVPKTLLSFAEEVLFGCLFCNLQTADCPAKANSTK